MQKADVKCDKLIRLINDCKPVDFLHGKFQIFCQDMFYDNWYDISMLFQEEKFQEYYNYILENFPYDYDDMTSEEMEIKSKFLALSFFSWESYLRYVFVLSRVCKKGISRFVDDVEENYFKNYLDNMLEYFKYYNRDTNKDLEDNQIEAMTSAFNFVDNLSKIDMVYNPSKSTEEFNEEEMEDLKDFFTESFIYYLEGLFLAVANFSSYLDNIKFKSKINV